MSELVNPKLGEFLTPGPERAMHELAHEVIVADARFIRDVTLGFGSSTQRFEDAVDRFASNYGDYTQHYGEPYGQVYDPERNVLGFLSPAIGLSEALELEHKYASLSHFVYQALEERWKIFRGKVQPVVSNAPLRLDERDFAAFQNLSISPEGLVGNLQQALSAQYRDIDDWLNATGSENSTHRYGFFMPGIRPADFRPDRSSLFGRDVDIPNSTTTRTRFNTAMRVTEKCLEVGIPLAGIPLSKVE